MKTCFSKITTIVLAALLMGASAANLHAVTFSDANWISMGGLPGANGSVSAAVVDGAGNLYIGGSFTTVGGVTANRIAKWNGSTWSALGSGMNSNVTALAASASDLYAGGSFTTAGGSAANYIAKWNGSSWSALGSGMNSNVSALAVSGSDLYAGGDFTTAGGSAASRIAKWNGSSWSALGSGIRGPQDYLYYGGRVYALAVSGSELYAGGGFTTAGGSAATNIAKWNGSNWSALGSGMGGEGGYSYVSALAVSGSDVYAGGYFTTAGGSVANRIAKWNGSSWSALGSGMNRYGYVYALAVSGSDLYAGGGFKTAGGSWASRIAKWNGSTWSALGSGMDNAVRALAVSGNDLYAGGYFWKAGGKVSTNVARADLGLSAEFPFADVTATVAPDLPAVASSSVTWADYDNDGRLDFLLTGASSIGPAVSQIWRNTGGGFTNVTATVAPGLPAVSSGAVAWGDYDNDGRLDFLLTGYSYDGDYHPVSELWRNTGSTFTNVTATVAPGLPGVSSSAVAWGDYDNDGRLDFLLTGYSYNGGYGSYPVSQVWRNTGSTFMNVTATVAPSLSGVKDGSVAWGDYDNDGRLDFLLTGSSYAGVISQVWRNTGSGFANVTDTVAPGLPGVYWSSVAWGDYDNDGWLDFLLTGWNSATNRQICQLCRNTGNGFVNVTTIVPGPTGFSSGSVAWGDYDNDGLLDFLLTTLQGSQLWRNTGSGFTNVTASVAPGLPPLGYSAVAWGDYDNDRRLDLLITGAVEGFCAYCDPPPRVSQLWRNNTPQSNPPPVVLTGLPTRASQTSVTLSATINPCGQAATGWFVWGNSTNYGNATAPQPMGNGSSATTCSATIMGLSTGVTYFYRAVGSNEQGLVIGAEQHFLLTPPSVTTSTALNLSATSAILKGQVNPNNLPTSGWFEWGPTPALGQVTPVQFLGNGFDFTLGETLSGLQVSNTYYFRAVALNAAGVVYGDAQSLFMEDVVPMVHCDGYVSPTNRSHSFGGGTNSLRVYLACDWMVINTNSWITITWPTNGIGQGGRLYYTVAVNTEPQPRSGTIVVGGHTFSISQAGGRPVILTQPTNQSVVGGQTARFSVTVAATMPVTYQWQCNSRPLADGNGVSGASTANLVLTNVQQSQAGSYRVVVSYASGSVRSYTAALTVSCGFSLAASYATFSSLSATGSVTLNAAVPLCLWNVVNTNGWVTVLSRIIDSGNRPVVYALAPNTTPTARTGNITIAGQNFTITQLAGASTNADISLAEALDTEDILSWSTIRTPAWFGQTFMSHDGMDAAQGGPISNSTAVTAMSIITGPGTLSWWWKVSSETNKDYLKFFVNGVQQTRISGEVDWQSLTYTYPSGVYTSKWTYSKNDKVAAGNDRGWLDQIQFVPAPGGTVALSPNNASHPSSSSTGLLSVAAGPSCAWSVLNTNSWISIASGANGTGNRSVTYLVATNPTPSVRSGNLWIANQHFFVTQSRSGINAPRLLFNGVSPGGNQHILSWPTNMDGFTLQSATNLTPPVVWIAVTNPQVVVGDQYRVTHSRSGSAQFFRLRWP